MDKPIRAIAGSCVHYTGVWGLGMVDIPCCAAGVNYHELVGEGPGWVAKLPCTPPIKGVRTRQVFCSKKQLPTAEEIAAYDAWMDEHFKVLQEAMERCRAHAAGKRDVQGVVECPACKGNLYYSIAGSNGHLWGKCETTNCLSWMQ